MRFLTKKQVSELDERIRSMENHINFLEDKLSDKHTKIVKVSNDLQSKTRYAEDYVKLYKQANKRNSDLESDLEKYKSKSETLEIVINKLQGDLCECKNEHVETIKKLRQYEDVAKKAFNELAHKARTKRLKKKKERELYYAILDMQKK